VRANCGKISEMACGGKQMQQNPVRIESSWPITQITQVRIIQLYSDVSNSLSESVGVCASIRNENG